METNNYFISNPELLANHIVFPQTKDIDILKYLDSMGYRLCFKDKNNNVIGICPEEYDTIDKDPFADLFTIDLKGFNVVSNIDEVKYPSLLEFINIYTLPYR